MLIKIHLLHQEDEGISHQKWEHILVRELDGHLKQGCLGSSVPNGIGSDQYDGR